MPSPKIPPPCWTLFDAEPITFDAGHVVIRFRGRDEHENPYGLIQGGLLAAMIDNCIGPAVYLISPDRQSTTIEMKVTYLEPARAGELLLGDARVIKHGRTAAFVEVSLTKEDGSLVARASATNVFLGRVDVPQSAHALMDAHGAGRKLMSGED